MVPVASAPSAELRDLGDENADVRVEAPEPEPLAPRYVVREPRRMAVKNMVTTCTVR